MNHDNYKYNDFFYNATTIIITFVISSIAIKNYDDYSYLGFLLSKYCIINILLYRKMINTYNSIHYYILLSIVVYYYTDTNRLVLLCLNVYTLLTFIYMYF